MATAELVSAAEMKAIDERIARNEANARAQVRADFDARRAAEREARAAESRETSFALAVENAVRRQPQIAKKFGTVGGFVEFARAVRVVVEVLAAIEKARGTSSEST